MQLIVFFLSTPQCHRGYTLASDDSQGLMSLNPLYIRNVPDTKVNSDTVSHWQTI